ncbi:acid phosphatase 1-like isoform X1 [Cucurbita moschata]|uniref:Acid phosphatase 1-like isoform X1 n=1 Tax=Cucurbita moschata TaxID=3662 RepID=A0A6J1G2F2_CUCMO|nr:acid phosphatase 1-like isoform X1 [Cucurbita moschata]
MASPTSILSLLLLAAVVSSAEVIRMYPREHLVRLDSDPECESWKFSVEVNAAGSWSSIPRPCVSFVQDYFNTGRYLSDSISVASYSENFALSVNVADGDGMDAWVFDVDETLLSNLPYYKDNGFGFNWNRSEPYNETSFNEWVYKGLAPVLPASLTLYKRVKKLGFKIFILTGRAEFQRAITEQNLIDAGYSGWEKLILRGHQDEGKKATLYKSEKRDELVKQGYRIQGNSGDQWSDLMGFALAKRSFKLPNPMYYVS